MCHLIQLIGRLLNTRTVYQPSTSSANHLIRDVTTVRHALQTQEEADIRSQQKKVAHAAKKRDESPESRAYRLSRSVVAIRDIQARRKRKRRSHRRFCEPPPQRTQVLASYEKIIDVGSMSANCKFCGAKMWIDERIQSSSKRKPLFQLCCRQGKARV